VCLGFPKVLDSAVSLSESIHQESYHAQRRRESTFVTESVRHIQAQLTSPTQEVIDAIGTGIGSNAPATIEGKRTELLAHFDDLANKSQSEPSHDDQHYVSRFDGVGLFQSALSKIFADVPNLQGFGNWNPIWVITEIEVFAHKVKAFLADIHEDATGKKQPVWAAIVSELLRLRTFDDRAPYPTVSLRASPFFS
jgi:hypothetical protein